MNPSITFGYDPKDKGKYTTPLKEKEGTVLENKLGLTSEVEINEKEVEGQLYAERVLFDMEQDFPDFNLKYLYEIHKLIFGEVYEFAGKLRTVNMSKGGFAFPSALHLETSMAQFEKDMLKSIPENYVDAEQLSEVVGRIHAELLFIHPFREGNGRTARIFANLMIQRAGYNKLNFDLLNDENGIKRYIKAVQHAVNQNYEPMKMIISEMLDI